MKTTLNLNTLLISSFFMTMLLTLPIQAHAAWGDEGMHAMGAPNLSPNQTEPLHHEVRVEEQHVQRAPVVRQTQTIPKPQEVRQKPLAARRDQPIVHPKTAEHHASIPDYFRHDTQYYGFVHDNFIYADLDAPFVVPDGFETVLLNGETFYFNQGVFYSEVNNQLVAIPAVLGAVVVSIPEDYQIVMADGVHYLVTNGVYYQRVDQGFQVVEPPVSNQE